MTTPCFANECRFTIRPETTVRPLHSDGRVKRWRPDSNCGFTLVEVLIALLMFVTIAVGVAQLVVVATRAMRGAREQTMAVMLASAKLDQLRALEWTYELEGAGDPIVARTDGDTDLSNEDLRGGGWGLRPSPGDTLAASAAYFADYLDDRGRWLAAGAAVPAGAVFVRRWSVRPLDAAPDRALVLQVLVTTVRDERVRGGPWSRRAGVEALLTSVRVRKRE
jgi:prepilin-type N-terminal cleavage/methylation domain-containing protein